jgi:hypothetical protein
MTLRTIWSKICSFRQRGTVRREIDEELQMKTQMIGTFNGMILLAATSGLVAGPEGPYPEGGRAKGERFHYLREPINTRRIERFPIVSPEGKYLFFTRWGSDDNEDVYWVGAATIPAMRSTTNILKENLK